MWELKLLNLMARVYNALLRYTERKLNAALTVYDRALDAAEHKLTCAHERAQVERNTACIELHHKYNKYIEAHNYVLNRIDDLKPIEQTQGS